MTVTGASGRWRMDIEDADSDRSAQYLVHFGSGMRLAPRVDGTCFRAFLALRSCLFILIPPFQGPSDPTTGMFGPEMQATPSWAPDIPSQVVSGPPQESLIGVTTTICI